MKKYLSFAFLFFLAFSAIGELDLKSPTAGNTVESLLKANTDGYSNALAQQYIYLCALAYCPASVISSWDLNLLLASHLTHWNLLYLSSRPSLERESAIINMVILENADTEQIAIAFTGTAEKLQLIDELVNSGSVPYPGISEGEAMSYFYKNYYYSFQDDLHTQLMSLSSSYSGYSYLYTGHSLGGALAVLAALETYTNGYLDAPPTVYTYGQPRVGNQAYAESLNANLPNLYRAVHNKDIVPHIPPMIDFNLAALPQQDQFILYSGQQEENDVVVSKFGLFWGPRHGGREIWYNQDFTSFIRCSLTESEDVACSDSLTIDYSIEDHLHYFGVDVGQACTME